MHDMDQQFELFESPRSTKTRLLITIAQLLLGDARDQKIAIDDLVDMVDSDIAVARRMRRILEAEPEMVRRHPEFYARTIMASG